MLEKFGTVMARGEIFSPASFAYSPAGAVPAPFAVSGTLSASGKISAAGPSSLCSNLAALAAASLLAEVRTTPKPGLVDRSNNGAHQDMNLEMFERSALALEESFRQCAETGIRLRDNLPEQDFSILAAELRSIGLQAERQMYAVTGGVNTHKGAIFSMGILCAAAAMEWTSASGMYNMQRLQENCRRIASALLADDQASGTHGLAARRENGTGGIRKEALSGFDTAFSIGLPALEKALEAGRSENDSLIYALLAIMAATEDSNLVHRGGLEGMDFAQKAARKLTEKGPAALDLRDVRRLDGEFIKRNLSPGGSADLLVLAGMLYRLKKGDQND